MTLSFQAIGLHGATIGSAILKEDKIEWRDRSNTAGGEFAKDLIKSINWQMVGAKGFLKVHMNDGSISSMDGFAQTDYEAIREFVLKKYGKELTKESVSFTLLSRRMNPSIRDGARTPLIPLHPSDLHLLSPTLSHLIVFVRRNEFRRDFSRR